MSCNIHPRTGLAAIGYRRDGRAIWPILGGAPSRLEEIDSRLEAIRTEIIEIQELPEPTDEDVTRTDTLLDERDQLTAEREPLAARAERIEAVRVAAAAPAARETGFGGGAPEVMTKRNPFEDNMTALRFDLNARYAPDLDQDDADGIIARAVTALTDYRPRGVTDDEVQNAVRTVEALPGAARHALLHGSPAYRSAFKTWLKAQGQSPLWTPEEHEAVRTAMSLSGSTGGYTLPTLLDPTLIHTGTASKDPLRAISRVVSGTQNVWHGVSVGNVSVYWTAEAAAMTEGSPTFSNPSVTAAKLTAYLTGSFEIFEDSDLQAQLPGLVGEAFSYTEQDAFVSGSGSGAPKGVLTAISGTSGDTVTCSTRGTFAYGDLTNLHDAVPVRYENTSTFLANKTTYTSIRSFATGSYGSLFWANLREDTPPQLIDSPYVKASAMTTSTASGSIFMIYGDFSQYLIYDRIGTMVEFVPQIFNSSALPTGQRGLVAHKRVGADCTDLNAFRFLKG